MLKSTREEPSYNRILNSYEGQKKNNYQLRLLYPAKLSFIIEEEIKHFHDKHKIHDH
jgi:hypothetical protein